LIGGTIIGNSLKILILTDGKIGDLVQCRGVAARLEKPSQITEAVVSPNWFHALPLPYIGIQKSDKAGQPNSPMNEPHPDLVIASGRRTILSNYFKRHLFEVAFCVCGGKCFNTLDKQAVDWHTKLRGGTFAKPTDLPRVFR